MQITRKQHFVWQSYLKNWYTDDKNELFVKGKDKGLSAKSILFEDYIYQIPILTKEELAQLKQFLNSFKFIDKQNESIFINILSQLSIWHYLKSYNNECEDQKFEKCQKEGLELFHTNIENYGLDLIKSADRKHLINLLKIDYNKIVLFILIQYFRTQNMRNNLYEVLPNESEALKRAKGLLLPILMAENIASIYVPSFKILINNTNNIFLTSNQPVINIAEDVDDKGNYLDFILYYPVNPNLAVEISFSNEEMYIETLFCTDHNVSHYNEYMMKNEIIISNRKFK